MKLPAIIVENSLLSLKFFKSNRKREGSKAAPITAGMESKRMRDFCSYMRKTQRCLPGMIMVLLLENSCNGYLSPKTE